MRKHVYKGVYTAYHNPSSTAEAPSRVDANSPFELAILLWRKYKGGAKMEKALLCKEWDAAVERILAREAEMDRKLKKRM